MPAVLESTPLSAPTPPARRARLLTGLLAGLLTVLASIALAPPAQAHPFGPPQTVVVDSHEGAVEVRWRVGGADDLTLLGVSLGVLPQDRVLLDGAAFFEDADALALAAAPEFGDYLLAHIGVSTDGRACPGAATVTDAFVDDGVALTYDCPGDVSTATVTVTTLTDLHPAYRTLATGPAGQRASYAESQPSHEWALDGATADGSGTSAALQLGAVLGALLLATLAGMAWRRRGRRA